MTRTLIAVFDNRGDAQSALEDLVSSGFSRQDIRLSEGDPTGAPSAGTAATGTSAGSGSIVDSIKHFLGSMFGTDNSEYVQKYSDAVTRGHQVLTLTAGEEREVERAADIVERWGPVDIDEKAAEWSGGALAGEAMRMGPGAQQQSAQMSQQSTGTRDTQGAQAQGSLQGSTQQGAQQRADAAQGDTAIPASERVGVRVFEHVEVVAAVPEDEDENYFRSHYNSNYAGGDEHYDDYAPAYRYGSQMAADEQYRGRPWKDVEPQLRSDWEGSNPNSAWSKFKAAIRHGWERITHH